MTDPAALTDKQWETLRAVHREPTATQEEIAATLDVTRATVSKRVNEIEGFDWTNRRAFVKRLFDEEPGDGPRIRNRSTREDQIHELESRISSLEERIGDGPARNDTAEWDPDLAHKIIHACLDAEYLSKEDELALLRRIL
ncbi:MarR family transcriptional regulator [Halosimplex carlsbadense]|uniref:MarR family transcriptional regulator n=1 Tax=Halosimplex carlsbadense TaxID=171164 RepID=UPI001377B467|nr:helix-turn-helix domain-containing protein [Halosimplex carlsbadense]